jgi:tetratricopeptide (TPR) repeat protein
MTRSRMFACLVVSLVFTGSSFAQPPKKGKKQPDNQPMAKGDKLPMTKLAPAKLLPELCLVKYRVSTDSPQCQAYFDQALGYFYSYVWMEAARSFETALQHDPNCAMAWWGLSRAIERWGKGQANDALKKAHELINRASHRESLLIQARLQEKGMWPNVGDQDKRKAAAVETIDSLLALYDDDEEGWYARAQLALGVGGATHGGKSASAPFYKALLRINPLHPGANHELVHFYENSRRPALGWPHAEMYIKSSPGQPHAFHMQAHLGMRIGRWDKTTDYSSRAIELQKTYHKVQGVKPSEDHQYAHHLETLMQSLIHDGRFKEARAVKKEAEANKYNNHKNHWFRLHLAEGAWDEALKLAEANRKDKTGFSYMRALVFLRKGETDKAAAEVAVLQEAYQNQGKQRSDKNLEARLWETQGWLMCQQGNGDGGVKLLAKNVDKSKDNYQAHAWGHGAEHMERWGIGALQANKLDVAEEAFLEALAHDSGSVRGALGMQVVCERQGRTEEATRFAAVAQRCWHKADPGRLDAELAFMRTDFSGKSPSPKSDMPPQR